MVTSDVEEDFSTKNNEISPKKHSSNSILIAENDTSNENFNNFKNEDFQSWDSNSEGKKMSYILIYFHLIYFKN